jgi:signal transduction histidine kinase
LRPQALAKGLTLDAEIDAASQDALVGDPTRVRQILLNLLSNAIKFIGKLLPLLGKLKPVRLLVGGASLN